MTAQNFRRAPWFFTPSHPVFEASSQDYVGNDAAERDLEIFDDHMLKDIGISAAPRSGGSCVTGAAFGEVFPRAKH